MRENDGEFRAVPALRAMQKLIGGHLYAGGNSGRGLLADLADLENGEVNIPVDHDHTKDASLLRFVAHGGRVSLEV